MRITGIVLIILVAVTFFAVPLAALYAKEIILYNFEKDPQGWEIPDWMLGNKDNAGRQISISEFHSSAGKYSLEIAADFSGQGWESAYVERIVDVTDWTPFNFLSVDILLPKDAPQGLRARMVLVIGEEWKWIEMNRSIPLSPGEWTVVKVDLTSKSLAWRKFVDDSFRSDVRKLGIRVESNGNIGYKGPVYIDNVKLTD